MTRLDELKIALVDATIELEAAQKKCTAAKIALVQEMKKPEVKP